jgi:4'-phosphopantetheinyl transferase EntD
MGLGGTDGTPAVSGALRICGVGLTVLLAEQVRRGLPYSVGVGIRRTSDGGVPALHPLEDDILGPRATDGRRLTFALGRAAARDALVELGIAPVAIGRGHGGEPLWPAGVVGAISHTRDVAVAVVGAAGVYAGLGVDVEELSRQLSPRAAQLVCTPAEIGWIDSWDPADNGRRLMLLFSAKEAVFKALFPVENVWLGFCDASLTWRAERCAFEARLLKSAGAAFPAGSVLEVQSTLTQTEVLSTTFALAR